jgi:hypothetical protein
MYIIASKDDKDIKHNFTAAERETLENMMWAFEGDKTRELVQIWFKGVIKRRFADTKWAGHTWDFKV